MPPARKPDRPFPRFLMVAVAATTLSCGGAEPRSADPIGPPTVERVEVVMDTATLTVNDTVQVTARVVGSDGSTLSGREVSWRASPAGVLESLGGGTFAAVGPGQATVTATADGRSGAAPATVVERLLQDNVIQADQVLALLTDSADVANGDMLRFRKLNDTVSFHVGDVVIGRQGGGFARVVTNVVSNGNEAVVQTRAATLPDIVKDGLVSIEYDGTLSQSLRNAVPGDAPLRVAPIEGVSVTPDGVIHLDNAELFNFNVSGSGTVNGLTISVNTNGRATPLLGPEVYPGAPTFSANARMKAVEFPPLRWFTFASAIGLDVDVDVTATVTGKLTSFAPAAFERSVELVRAKLVCGWMAEVVYACAYLVAEAYAHVDATVSGTVKTGAYNLSRATAIVSWHHATGWNNQFIPLDGPSGVDTPEFSIVGGAGCSSA